MRNKISCFMIIAMLLCVLGASACAENRYQALCAQHGINGADVIAWLEIPGMTLCEPVMRHPQDDAYYAKRDAAGNLCQTGSLYVQAGHNAADFEDPVTLIYGSSALETECFGSLQEQYSGNFDQCTSVYLHLPEGTCEYSVFAALPHSSIHILHYYDFSVPRRFDNFFDQVFSIRALGMHLVEAQRPEAQRDRVVILSTGLRGDSLQRYLVMAKRITP